MIKTDIIFVDVDNTLRKTKSGNPYPIYKTDYVILKPMVDYIQDLLKVRNYKIIFVTNQSQIRNSEKQLATYQFNINDLISKLPFPVYKVFFSPNKSDDYRKPKVNALLRDLGALGISPSSNCIMIGDSGGRPGDYTDADLEFAKNVGAQFIHSHDILK